jgi:4-aminobutyrate aminotransferase-like enzyme
MTPGATEDSAGWASAYIAGQPSDETVAPLRFGSAEGPFIITTEGRRLLDWSTCLNAPLGHSVRLDTTALPVNAGNYPTEQRDALVRRLQQLLPGLAGFQLRSSGAEAVEAGLRYLTAAFGSVPHSVTIEGCYHGLTLGARQLMGTAAADTARTELPFALLEDPTAAAQVLGGLLGDGPVAVWIEPVQGATLRRVPAGFLELLSSLRARHPRRMALVCDDMLASIRCGSWCSVPVEPDLFIGGKSWASGYPFSFFGTAAWVREAGGDILGTTSYGGNPVACAHALHTIDRVGPLLERVREIEAAYAPRLARAAAERAEVLRSEWHGMLFGWEMRDAAVALETARRAADDGLLVAQLGPVIRCSPPLDSGDDLLDLGLSRLLGAVAPGG